MQASEQTSVLNDAKVESQPAEPRRRSRPLLTTAALAIILLVGACSRFNDIGAQSLWLDEYWSVYISTARGTLAFSMPDGQIMAPPQLMSLAGAPAWWRIWTSMKYVTHPPLYHIVLRWWMDLFGTGDAATRSLSAAMSMAAILVLFDTVRRMEGALGAVVAAAVLALASSQIDYSQETRGYTMLALLGLLACHAIVRIEQARRAQSLPGQTSPPAPGGATVLRLTQLGIATAAALLTHYFAVFLFVGIGIYVLLRLRGRDLSKTSGTMIAAALLVAVVWGPQYWQQHLNHAFQGNDWLKMPGHRGFLDRIPMIFTVATYHVDARKHFNPLIDDVIWRGVVLLVFVVPLALAWLKPQRLLWWCCVVGAMGGQILVDSIWGLRSISLHRYSVQATPAICALLAAPFPIPHWSRWIFPFVLGGLVMASGLDAVQEQFPKADVRTLCLQANNIAAKDDILVFRGNALFSPGFTYLAFNHYVPQSQRQVMFLNFNGDAPSSPEILKQLSGHQFLVIAPRAVGAPIDQLMPGFKTISRSASLAGEITRMEPSP